MVLGLGAAIASAYAAAYPLLGTAHPFGWDSPVYVWWARVAESTGSSSPLIGARPGTVGVVAALAATLHVQTTTVVAALTLAALAATALAGAALVSQCLGPDPLRFVLVAALLGGEMWLLAAGYLSTLIFTAEFLAAMVLIVRARSRPNAVAAGLLLGAGGASHPLFMLWALATVAPALLVVAIVRRWAARVFLIRAITSIVIGVGATAVTILVTGGLHPNALEFSRDGMLKPVGLGSLSVSFHQDKMMAAAPFFAVSMVSACLCITRSRRFVRWARGAPSAAGVFVSGVTATWVGGTLIAAALLLLSVPAPAQRLVIFCLPLSMLAAVGAAAVFRPDAPSRSSSPARAAGRRVLVAAAMLVVWIGIGLAAIGWWAESKSSTVSTQSLGIERTVGGAVAATPAGSPVVVVIDGADDRVIAKAETLLRDGMPPSRIADVRFFIGSRADFVRGGVRGKGVPERDRLAVLHWRDIRPLLSQHPLVLTLGRMDRAETDWKQIGPGVGELGKPGFALVSRVDVRRALQTGAFPSADVSPAAPFLLAIALVLMFGVLGRSLTRLMTGDDCTDEVAYGLAPAAGLAVVMAAAILASVAGVRVESVEGQLLIAAIVGGAIAFCVAASTRRAPRSPMRTSLDGNPA